MRSPPPPTPHRPSSRARPCCPSSPFLWAAAPPTHPPRESPEPALPQPAAPGRGTRGARCALLNGRACALCIMQHGRGCCSRCCTDRWNCACVHAHACVRRCLGRGVHPPSALNSRPTLRAATRCRCCPPRLPPQRPPSPPTPVPRPLAQTKGREAPRSTHTAAAAACTTDPAPRPQPNPPAPALHLWVVRELVHDAGNGGGCGVVPRKQECLHLRRGAGCGVRGAGGAGSGTRQW